MSGTRQATTAIVPVRVLCIPNPYLLTQVHYTKISTTSGKREVQNILTILKDNQITTSKKIDTDNANYKNTVIRKYQIKQIACGNTSI